MRTTARKAIAGAILAVGLPLAAAGIAGAQSAPSGASGPSGPSGPTTTGNVITTVSSVVSSVTGSTGTGGLARTGGELAVPLAASGAALATVLAGRARLRRS